jgi:hypothetical protein
MDSTARLTSALPRKRTYAAAKDGGEAVYRPAGASATKRLRILPRLSISVSITSPALRNVLVPWPTPPQVPQLKKSPESSERIFEAY